MLKRLLLMLAAVAAMVGSPLAVDLAQAREHGGGRGGDRGGDQGGGRGRGGGPRFEGPRERGGDERRGGGGRWERQGPPDWPRYGGPRQRYEPEPYVEAPRAPRVRPGGYLPPAYRGGVIEDYGRYRLRPPPRGYAWVRIGRDLALVSLDDGRIFDVAPF